MQERLIFVISPPRAGSTLLQRMLGAHTDVLTHPEPHLVTPLAYLGFHGTVDKAPYDHINSAEAMKLFVSKLPRGEDDYLDALRAYADTLYGRMLEQLSDGRENTRFLDKTPAYALVLPFLAKLYPRAKFVVLTRHPLAVFSSYANSFFDGSWSDAHAFNPILERYVPAMASFLRERPVPMLQIGYEDMVAEPEKALERIFAFCGMENQPEAVNYGEREGGQSQEGPGDPINVHRHKRPTTGSLHKWAEELKADPSKLALAQDMIAKLSDEDLETWGYPRRTLFDALEAAEGTGVKKPPMNKYVMQRKIFLALRKNIHERPHGKALKKIKYYCDVLLRE